MVYVDWISVDEELGGKWGIEERAPLAA